MKINIGLILPGSSIVPSMGKDFKKGFELALEQNNLDSIEIIPAFVNHGGLPDVQKAAEKLIQYDDVDLITGIISNAVAFQLIEFFKNNKIPLLLNNLGENIHLQNSLPDFYYLNSLHLWKSQWALGYWAQKKYGGDVSLCMTVYDAGYHLHEAFRLGAEAAGGQTTHYNVLKIQPGIVNTEALIQHIKEQKPGHVHALLCGKDTHDFYTRFKNEGFLGKIPLTASPFFDTFENEQNLNPKTEIHTASTWESKEINNYEFHSNYLKTHGIKASAFALLGYESGLLLADSAQKSTTKEELNKNLKNANIIGPRGKISYDFPDAVDDAEVRIKQFQINTKKLNGSQFQKTKSLPNHNDFKIQEIVAKNISGWQNPYLCI